MLSTKGYRRSHIRYQDEKYYSCKPIYTSTFAYSIAFLRQTEPSRVNILKAKYRNLTASMGEMDLLVNHNLVYAVLRKHLERYPQDPALVHKALTIDRDLIAARIYVLLRCCERRRLFMNQKNHRAQSLLNLMQELLNNASLDLGEYRSPITTAVIQLSRNAGLYPERLLLRDVFIQDKFASAGGRYGDVYEGNLWGRAVAVKMMRACGYDADAAMRLMKAFAKEAVLWAQLSSPYILQFYGVYAMTKPVPRLGLVSPWMKNGNLTQYLNKTPQIDRMPLMKDIAFGLYYLHSFDPQVIHGDLKGSNILITDDHRACVADFGLCLLAQNSALQITMTSSSNDHGSLFWMAPELINDEEETQCKNCATDVYAFGCVCYEIFNGKPPFSDLSTYKARLAIKESRIPPRPTHPDLDETVWMLILKCLRGDPESRPSMSEIAQQLSFQQNL
ncbi:kinase-like domain-containing protein [Hygrophoropsis aurantiaca]|uniref:Kinase-like domain-containing protein n=1 Tax=Hygrophoropsis aurantiaca TaxID=72124 RepID=A0ACB8A1D7_9AGAM|nr:kinase-like domain-containing protein [Hygrophoropsis aurantiaca]